MPTATRFVILSETRRNNDELTPAHVIQMLIAYFAEAALHGRDDAPWKALAEEVLDLGGGFTEAGAGFYE